MKTYIHGEEIRDLHEDGGLFNGAGGGGRTGGVAREQHINLI